MQMGNAKMPLFIQNEQELENEDDGPIPANTPNTGRLNNGRVVACGNRVLEIIERHIKDVRDRKVMHENAFKEMLRKAKKQKEQAVSKITTNPARNSIPHHTSPPHVSPEISKQVVEQARQNETKKRSIDEEQKVYIPTTPNHKKPHSAEVSDREKRETFQFQPKLPSIESDEYLELPSPKKAQNLKGIRLSADKERHQTEHSNLASGKQNSKRTSADAHSNVLKTSVRFSDDTKVKHMSPERVQNKRSSILNALKESNFEVSVREPNENEPLYQPPEECFCQSDSNYDNNNFFPSSSVRLQTEVLTEGCEDITQGSLTETQVRSRPQGRTFNNSTGQNTYENHVESQHSQSRGRPQGRTFYNSNGLRQNNNQDETESQSNFGPQNQSLFNFVDQDDDHAESIDDITVPDIIEDSYRNSEETLTHTTAPSGSSARILHSNENGHIDAENNRTNQINYAFNNAPNLRLRQKKVAPVASTQSSTGPNFRGYLWYVGIAILLFLLILGFIILTVGVGKHGDMEEEEVDSTNLRDTDHRRFVQYDGPVM